MAGPLKVVVTIPGLKVKSEMNLREHHMVTYRRKRDQKALTRLFLAQLGKDARDALAAAPKVTVRFARIGGRALDSDNATTAFKFVRDAVADWLGKSDGPGSGIEWAMPPDQEPGEPGIRITLEATP